MMRHLIDGRSGMLRRAWVIAVVVIGAFAGSTSAAVSFQWATVGNAGNAADPLNSGRVPGIGAVGYAYRISKYEVTNAQYAAFLNAVAKSDPNGLYNNGMNVFARGGIIRSGASGSYTYSVKPNMADKPVNYVDWFDAARFTNWLTNGQGSGGTESGVYTLTGPTAISAVTRDMNNPNEVFLPTEDEWYKAAYHQPASQGGDSDDYWLYPTASNNVPTRATATSAGDIANPGANVANYGRDADWNSEDGNVTTVGSAGPNSASYYGTCDQGGNVWEWVENLIEQQPSGTLSSLFRGGTFSDNVAVLQSSRRLSLVAGTEGEGSGFRVASPIPEPTSLALLGLGGIVLLRRTR